MKKRKLVRIKVVDRLCSRCKRTDTYPNKMGYPIWCHDENSNVICKRCYNKQNSKQWHLDNYQQELQRFRQWRLDHPGYNAVKSRQWYRDNIEYVRVYRKIVQHRGNTLARDRRNLRSGLWIP